jgi:hypothetical protein
MNSSLFHIAVGITVIFSRVDATSVSPLHCGISYNEEVGGLTVEECDEICGVDEFCSGYEYSSQSETCLFLYGFEIQAKIDGQRKLMLPMMDGLCLRNESEFIRNEFDCMKREPVSVSADMNKCIALCDQTCSGLRFNMVEQTCFLYSTLPGNKESDVCLRSDFISSDVPGNEAESTNKTTASPTVKETPTIPDKSVLPENPALNKTNKISCPCFSAADFKESFGTSKLNKERSCRKDENRLWGLEFDDKSFFKMNMRKKLCNSNGIQQQMSTRKETRACKRLLRKMCSS